MDIPELVSIVVPVYNGESFLHENVKSIMHQTYTNLEIIYVCAGCADNSEEILRGYLKSDERLKLYIEKENHGLAYSRNIGMDIANGEWIIFLDCDDLFEQDMIEVMVKQAVKEQADICCCFWDGFSEHFSGRRFTTSELVKRYCDTYPIINVFNMQKYLFQIVEYNAWTKLIHKSIYKKTSVDFGSFPNCEDFYFSLVAAMEASKIVYVDQILVHYRMQTGGNTQTTMMHNKKSYVWEVLDAIFERIKKKENNSDLKQSFYNCVCKNIYNAKASSIYNRIFDDLYEIYFEKWNMLSDEVLEKLSYFNQEVYKKVHIHNMLMDYSEMIMCAKMRFIANMQKKGTCGIWGCGYQGQTILEKLSKTDIHIQHIFDSDKNKWGMKIFGYVVDQYMGNEIESIIVTSPKYYKEIKNQIEGSVKKIYNLEEAIFIH